MKVNTVNKAGEKTGQFVIPSDMADSPQVISVTWRKSLSGKIRFSGILLSKIEKDLWKREMFTTATKSVVRGHIIEADGNESDERTKEFWSAENMSVYRMILYRTEEFPELQ